MFKMDRLLFIHLSTFLFCKLLTRSWIVRYHAVMPKAEMGFEVYNDGQLCRFSSDGFPELGILRGLGGYSVEALG